MRSSYSRWDGSQKIDDLDADDLLNAMADDLTADGDLWNALRRLFQRGMHDPNGPQMPGLQDLLQQLKRRRQQQLDRYDLGSTLEDIKKKLEEVVGKERAGVERMAPGKDKTEHEQRMAQLPPDPAGRIKQLQEYDFVDPEAEQLFQDLLKSLQEQMLKPFMQGMKQALSGMTPQDMQRLREMLRDLNRMLREKADGEEPDFQSFKDKWGQQFPGVESFDQLMEQIGRQMAQMESLMQSMSPGQRRELEEMMRQLFLQDERLEAEMRQLGMNLSELLPLDEMARQYKFRGDDELTMKEAMQLMEELSQMEQLEQQIRGAKGPKDIDKIDPADVEKLVGPEAARDLERLREIAKKLEEAGYLERDGDKMRLTARAIRKIG